MKALNKETAPKAQRPERIIQFGEGNFLRAFVDWIIYNMNQKTDFNSNVVVVQPIDKGMVDMLNAQDDLYHVNLQGLDKGETINSLTMIDVISRALNPYTQNDEFMKLAEQPEMRFVISNTTEAGIAFDPACKLTDTPASSYPGKLTQLLYHRFKTFNGDKSKGLIIFPCELIFLNGHKLKETIYQYIELWQLGDEFRTWFEEACGVYATLVDRIVPGFPRKDIAAIKEKIQYDDNLVVQAEIFHLWVIEAPQEVAEEFPADKAGLNVLFVPSEEPYHERKVTLLNGPHTVLSPVAYLSEVNIVRDACQHPIIGQYIHKVMFDELMETLNLPKNELKKFAEDVLERFNNPFVDHAITSIMLNSFPKYQTRDLPGLKTYLKRKGELPKGLALGLAAIITYYKGGTRADGTEIIPNDAPEIMQLLKDLWATGDTRKVAEGVLAAKDLIWGEHGDSVRNDAQGEKMKEDIRNASHGGESLGGIIECVTINMPAGVGSPIFEGLENTIAQLIFGIPAVKGLEFGAGFQVAEMVGSQNNDPFYIDEKGHVMTKTNNHGGILGGISSGMPITLNVAIKPTASIAKPQETVDFRAKTNEMLQIQGRHDPCIVPRAVPCVEAAMNIALLSHMMDYPHF